MEGCSEMLWQAQGRGMQEKCPFDLPHIQSKARASRTKDRAKLWKPRRERDRAAESQVMEGPRMAAEGSGIWKRQHQLNTGFNPTTCFNSLKAETVALWNTFLSVSASPSSA